MINDIYLTGFSGQIGTELRKVFFKKNIGITLLGRKEPSLNQNERFIFFDLNKKFNPDFISKEIIVIHLAHDFKKYKSNVNFSGTENLLSFFSNRSSTRFIFISTPHGDNPKMDSSYQSEKKATENLFSTNDLILMPSFIYSEKGKTNSLLKFIKNIKVPILIPKQVNDIAPIKLSAFCEFLTKEENLLNLKGRYLILGKRDLSFSLFLKDFYNLNSLKAPNFFFLLLIKVFSLIPSPYIFYIEDRIKGLLNLPDLKKTKEKKILIS